MNVVEDDFGVVITDIIGNQVYADQINSTSQEINLKGLAIGMYNVTLGNTSKSIQRS